MPVTRQAMAEHLGVLDGVGLVRATLAGREKRYRVDGAHLARVVAQRIKVVERTLPRGRVPTGEKCAPGFR